MAQTHPDLETVTEGHLHSLLRHCSAILQQDPQNLRAQLTFAEVLKRLGRVEDAIRFYRSAALSYGMAGHLGQAILVCKTILEINPAHLETQDLLARLYATRFSRDEKQRIAVYRSGATWIADPHSAGGNAKDPTRGHPSDCTEGWAAMAVTEEATDPSLTPLPALLKPQDSGPEGIEADLEVDSEAECQHSGKTRSLRTGTAGTRGDPLPAHPSSPSERRFSPRVIRGALSLDAHLRRVGQGDFDAEDLAHIQHEVDHAFGRQAPVLHQAPKGSLPSGLSALIAALPPSSLAAEDPHALDLHFPFFSDLEAEAFALVIAQLDPRMVQAGEVVFREGDAGDSLYVIARGTLEVLKKSPHGLDVVLSTLSTGAFFGEFAFLTDQHRHATVRATRDSVLLELRREVLHGLIQQHPSIAWTLRVFYQQRLMAMVLTAFPLFQHIPVENRREALERFLLKRCLAGETLIEEGSRNTGFFVVLTGCVSVSTRSTQGGQVPICQLAEGDFFGEISLLTGAVAGATVVAERDTELLTLSSGDFYELAARHPAFWAQVERFAAQRQEETAQRRIAGSLTEMVTSEGCLL